jgi:murein L,D-transpeptidase YcbB/YkuD
MRKDAAAHLLARNVALRAQGRGMVSANGSMSGYRDYAGQVYMRNYWCARGACGNAAVPGTSNHGWGIAIDSNQAYLLDGSGQPFDKHYSDAPWEPWHRRDGHVSQTVYAPPRPPKPRNPTLRPGANQHAVKYLKALLRDRGVKRATKGHRVFPPVDHGKKYGRNAVKRVEWFQRAKHLKVDGIVGPHTWAALKKAAKN